MAAQNAVRIVHIRGTSEGLAELEQDLRAVSDAQDNLAKTSETTARTTETTSRRQLSAASAYDRLRGQIDQQYRAQRQLERGQQTLDRAFQQGIATQGEYDRAMAQLRERYMSAAAANDNFKAANDNVARSVEQSTGLIDRLKSSVSQLVLAYVSIQGVRMLGDMADQWSEIQARVVNATGSFEGGQAVLERLGEMARRTYSDLDRTAESWLSSSTSLTALGVSISDQLDLVESFNNALVISATRGQRAESVQRAWSDAISLGKMNMDQFNTVMTGSDRLAQALADSMGVNVLELRKMASDGKITRDAMLGLSSQLGTLREEADRMPATIADGMTLIRNALLMTIGMMDQAGGASESFAAGLVVIADNMQRIVTYAGMAVTAYGVYYVGAMVAARVATLGLTGALALLRTALIRLGIGALVVAAGELIYQFTRLSSAAGGFGEAMALLGDVASEVWDRIKLDGQSLVLDLQSVWESIKAGFLSMIAAMQKRWAEFLYYMADSAPTASMAKMLEDAGMKAGSAYLETERAASAAREEAERLGNAAQEAAEKSRAPLESIAALRKALADAGSAELPGGSSRVTLPSDIDSKAADKAAREAKKLEEAYERLTSRAHDFIASQELEASVIGMSEQAAQALRFEFDLLNDARRAGLTLTESDRAGFKALADAMAEAEARTRSLQEQFKFIKDITTGFFNDFRSDLMNNMQQGMSFWDATWNAMASAAVKAIDKIIDKLMSDLMDAMFEVGNSSGGGGGWLGSLFGGIFGGGRGGFPAAPAPITGLWANGGVFESLRPTPFAMGGAFTNSIVNQPTLFPFADGVGMMGEAGPEAIMPLRRGPDGRLGVSAANSNGLAPSRVQVEVEVFVNDDGTLGAIARTAGGEAADVKVRQGLEAYDKARSNRYANGAEFG
ncbi:tape measure protein [Aliihoeflea sp. PC F10.4]